MGCYVNLYSTFFSYYSIKMSQTITLGSENGSAFVKAIVRFYVQSGNPNGIINGLEFVDTKGNKYSAYAQGNSFQDVSMPTVYDATKRLHSVSLDIASGFNVLVSKNINNRLVELYFRKDTSVISSLRDSLNSDTSTGGKFLSLPSSRIVSGLTLNITDLGNNEQQIEVVKLLGTSNTLSGVSDVGPFHELTSTCRHEGNTLCSDSAAGKKNTMVKNGDKTFKSSFDSCQVTCSSLVPDASQNESIFGYELGEGGSLIVLGSMFLVLFIILVILLIQVFEVSTIISVVSSMFVSAGLVGLFVFVTNFGVN
jgi:hypothetical protein